MYISILTRKCGN